LTQVWWSFLLQCSNNVQCSMLRWGSKNSTVLLLHLLAVRLWDDTIYLTSDFAALCFFFSKFFASNS
jgi:hypothetical protein